MDWIERFLEYTDGITSPEIFRLWGGISAVAGALERRVWVRTARSDLYPSLYVLLVASPGVGKSEILKIVKSLWSDARKFHPAPDNVTKASLLDCLAEADRKIINGEGLFEYHTLLVASLEFGVLVPAHDLEFLNVLNHIYDCPKDYREVRRTTNKNLEIINPQLNIVAGTQPAYLSSLMPEEAWAMGFTSRLIMVYSSEAPEVSLFGDNDPRVEEYNWLVARLREMATLMGPFTWEESAKSALEKWVKAKLPPVPDHSKLTHYTPRRVLHAIKLAMVSTVARSCKLHITLADVERAKFWLLQAERIMPDIFREMIQRSDAQVIQELHFFAWRLWLKENKVPVHESRLISFLKNRLPSEKVLRVLEIATKSGMLQSEGGGLYTPRPKQDHGVE
jgi:hypothetical protein